MKFKLKEGTDREYKKFMRWFDGLSEYESSIVLDMALKKKLPSFKNMTDDQLWGLRSDFEHSKVVQPQLVYRNLTDYFKDNRILDSIPYNLSKDQRVEAESALQVMLNELTDIICRTNDYEMLS